MRRDDVSNDSCYDHDLLLFPFDVVDDRNNGGLRRYFLRFERERRLAPAAHINRFTSTRAYSIDSDNCRPIGKTPNEK